MAESIKIVIAADCMGDGEAFLRGERRTVSKQVHRQLVAAGRVCTTPEAEEAAEAELARRITAEKPAKGLKLAKGEQAPPTEPPPPPTNPPAA